MPSLAAAFLSVTPPGFHEDEGARYAGETMLREKFRHWRGRSGRAYVFSVYAPRECPAYADAVLLIVTREGETLACVDLGAWPEARLDKLRRIFADRLHEIEFQIHVLADRASERRGLVADLSPRAA